MIKNRKLVPMLCAALLLSSCSWGRKVEIVESSVPDSTAAAESTQSSEAPEPVQNTEQTQLEYEGVVPLTLEVTGDYRNISIENEYGVNVLHTGVVGLVGCPVKVKTKGLTRGTLTFRYEDADLGDTPEGNLALLHYDSSSGTYEYSVFEHDEDENTVSTTIRGSGVFMLVDDYLWSSAWGRDTTGLTPTPEPEPEAEVYDMANNGFHGTVTVPPYAKIFDHNENYERDYYYFATFLRVSPNWDSTRSLWMDISYITPKEQMDLEAFAQMMFEHRIDLLAHPEEHWQDITMLDMVDITSADGVAGKRLRANIVYNSPDGEGGWYKTSEYYTYYDYYPCDEEGYYEFHAEYIQLEPGGDGVAMEDAEELLGSVRLVAGE